MSSNYPVVLAITAASGVIYGLKTLEALLNHGYKVELIISKKAYYIFEHELNIELQDCKSAIKNRLLEFLDLKSKDSLLKVWLNNEVWASPASGSYKIHSMIIAPASMSTVAAVANGYADNLITRAADVAIKEKSLLSVVPRETPLSAIHLENLLKLATLGVNVVPPIVAFYCNTTSLEKALSFVTGKILDSVGIENKLYERWHHE